jgi:molybdate transport system substrate-binding protein
VSIMRTLLLLVAIFSAMLTDRTMAETVNVAVAANFTEAARELARTFRENTGHEAILSFGSSGQLYTQIRESAPFEVFLSADEERPKKLVDEGYGVAEQTFTYAIGRLVLWSRKSGFVKNDEILKKGNFEKLAIANPDAAPYGAAAIEVMKKLNLYNRLQPRIVEGNSIAQVFQFANTDNAELAFVALSQIQNLKLGSWWIVPEKYHRPIRQNAVLLKSGEKNTAAQAFIAFLRSSISRSIIQKFGYETGEIAGRTE